MNKRFRYYVDSFLDILFPRICKVCRQALQHHEEHICLLCFGRLPITYSWDRAFNPMQNIFKGRMQFIHQYGFLNFEKQGMTQALMHQIKYHQQTELATYLGSLFAHEIKDILKEIDYLIPIPLHPKKLKRRGYNQALKIAEGIQAIHPIPILEHALIKTVDNISQTKIKRVDKFSNVSDAYTWQNDDILSNAHLMLIDDVCTTGSTIESCALALQKANFKHLSVGTLAVVSPL